MWPQKCFVKGCDGRASFGLRLPGPQKDIPKELRGYLWHCEEHRAEARERRAAAMKKANIEIPIGQES